MRYRAGIVGCGRIGWKLEDDPNRPKPCTHAGAYASIPNTQIVAASSRTDKSLKGFGERFGVDALYTDFNEMLEKENLDLLSVTTNPELHRDIVVKAAECGVRGILCEKPISLSLDDADDMIEACRKSGTVLMVMHNRRWNSYYVKAKELLDLGAIGELVSIFGNCQGCKPSPDWLSDREGPLLHDATHLYDIMRFFAGDIDSVVGSAEKRKHLHYGVEDTCFSHMRFKNGVSAVALVNERTSYMRFDIELQGSDGKILLGPDAEMWQVVPSKRAAGFRELEKVEFPKPEREANVYMDAIGELIHCVETGEPSRSTGEDGRAALEAIMAIYESQRRGNSPVQLPLGVRESLLLALRRENRL
ncbi:MAG: Gfo/Idh/MocA family oxidoreductase [Bacillota bacterium]|jgi:predicted dehydrogenase|nr:Gfo/Idh/MocA family oxidoreductase [Bacillota bacterium]HPZ13846.1 Gfo/Idh/MocA family oxidoreductase [Bacillota bacterium]HQD80522.1 Gfo/Idh/MocA family oxidoreductase [Bacillota bacterium]